LIGAWTFSAARTGLSASRSFAEIPKTWGRGLQCRTSQHANTNRNKTQLLRREWLSRGWLTATAIPDRSRCLPSRHGVMITA
jgi:hypothetical protein